jgi:hypothetical protein
MNQNGMMFALAHGQKFDKLAIQGISEDILTHTDQILKMLQNYCKLVEKQPAEASDFPAEVEGIKKAIAGPAKTRREPTTRPAPKSASRTKPATRATSNSASPPDAISLSGGSPDLRRVVNPPIATTRIQIPRGSFPQLL